MAKPDSPKGEACVCCYFFKVLTNHPMGHCHRYPPVTFNDGGGSHQTPVSYYDWCGEFKPAKEVKDGKENQAAESPEG